MAEVEDRKRMNGWARHVAQRDLRRFRVVRAAGMGATIGVLWGIATWMR